MERHPFDPLSFVFGALFVAVAVVGLIGVDLLELQDLRWIAPALLVLAGAALLFGSGRQRSDDRAHEPQDGQARASDAPTMGPGSHDR